MRKLRRNNAIVLAVVLCIGRAVAQDAFTREAEDIFIAYLRINTSNPPGNETAGARFLQQILVREGIDAKLVGSNPARQSVYARLSSGSNEKALLLLHHIDVVPADTSVWTKPPFGGVRANGYIFGRGALDMKSIGVAELMAMIDLKRRQTPLRRDVIFLGVADEERGGIHGCKELLDDHPELFANVGYVLNEAGYNETYVDRVGFWGIEVQQKVPLFLRIHMRGFAGHAASPPADGGTMAKLVDVLENVKHIATPYRLTPVVAQSFAAIGASKTDYKGEALRSLAKGSDPERVAKTLPDGFRSLLHDTIAITQIHGGVCTNCLPSEAIADVDIRLLDDEKPDAMLAKVKALLPKEAQLEVLLRGDPTPASSTNSDLYRLLAADFKRAENGSAVAPIVGAGTSDSRYFRARGIQAYGIAPFKVNYYDADTVHAADERIRARFFDEGVDLMSEIVHDFCAKR